MAESVPIRFMYRFARGRNFPTAHHSKPAPARRRGSMARRQRGQVLVLGVLLLFVLVAATTLLAAGARLVSEKTRLVTAADSAALAAATWRARALNFAAYSNRALVAQEVVIAQAVTLAAWSRYFDRLVETTQRLETVPPPLSILAGEQVASQARRALESAEQALTAELWLRSAPEGGYKSLLVEAQAMLIQSAGVFGSGAIANEVARANDARFFAFALSDDQGFERFTQRQQEPADRQRFAQIVHESLDTFVVGPREGTRSFVVRDNCSGPAGTIEVQFTKRGATRLSEQLDQWLGADTASIHVQAADLDTPDQSSILDCSSREREVWAWGVAQAGSAEQTGSAAVWQANVENPRARRIAMAQLQATRAYEFVTYDGIAIVRDLAASLRDLQQPAKSSVAVLARLDARSISASVLTDQSIGARGAPLPNGRLWALSAAEAYFRQPGLAEGELALASLHGPFWQSRLAPIAPQHREQALRYAQ